MGKMLCHRRQNKARENCEHVDSMTADAVANALEKNVQPGFRRCINIVACTPTITGNRRDNRQSPLARMFKIVGQPDYERNNREKVRAQNVFRSGIIGLRLPLVSENAMSDKRELNCSEYCGCSRKHSGMSIGVSQVCGADSDALCAESEQVGSHGLELLRIACDQEEPSPRRSQQARDFHSDCRCSPQHENA